MAKKIVVISAKDLEDSVSRESITPETGISLPLIAKYSLPLKRAKALLKHHKHTQNKDYDTQTLLGGKIG